MCPASARKVSLAALLFLGTSVGVDARADCPSGNSLCNVRVSPEGPACLEHGENVDVTFKYMRRFIDGAIVVGLCGLIQSRLLGMLQWWGRREQRSGKPKTTLESPTVAVPQEHHLGSLLAQLGLQGQQLKGQEIPVLRDRITLVLGLKSRDLALQGGDSGLAGGGCGFPGTAGTMVSVVPIMKSTRPGVPMGLLEAVFGSDAFEGLLATVYGTDTAPGIIDVLFDHRDALLNLHARLLAIEQGP